MERRGEDNPLRRRPAMIPWLGWIWQCFCELRGQVGHSESVSLPIRLADVLAWCDLHGVRDRRAARDAWAIVQRLDQRWRVLEAEAIERRRERERAQAKVKIR